MILRQDSHLKQKEWTLFTTVAKSTLLFFGYIFKNHSFKKKSSDLGLCLTDCNIWTSQVLPMVKNLLAIAGYARDLGSIPGSRKWQPTPVRFPKKSHGQRNLAGYSHGVAESDTTEHIRLTTCTVIIHTPLLFWGEHCRECVYRELK